MYLAEDGRIQHNLNGRTKKMVLGPRESLPPRRLPGSEDDRTTEVRSTNTNHWGASWLRIVLRWLCAERTVVAHVLFAPC